jgi:hypothetical protein
VAEIRGDGIASSKRWQGEGITAGVSVIPASCGRGMRESSQFASFKDYE